MRQAIFNWATVIGAFARATALRQKMTTMSFYDRLRLCNAILGPDWIFRLHDVVGSKIIGENRPSWLNFYKSDIYGEHLPLDPRAPETEKFLGEDAGVKEFAFYAAMGFDGYALALSTKRSVDTSSSSVTLGEFRLPELADDQLESLRTREILASDYYSAYGEALDALFDAFEEVAQHPSRSDDVFESIAAACLLFLCGGHHGCKCHIDKDEEREVRLQTIIICKHVTALCKGSVRLKKQYLEAA